jgi:PKD repeat protein
VQDSTAPVLTLPADIIAEAPDETGTTVSYTVTAEDVVDGHITPSCNYESGDFFPIGATTVDCSATDSAGNSSTASFHVLVTTDSDRAAGGDCDSAGCVLTTPDGSVQIIVPAGALDQGVYLSITESGTSFEITTNQGNGGALFGVTFQPALIEFNEAVTIIFSWTDNEREGFIDGTNIKEENVIITKDNDAITDKCKNEPVDGDLPDCDQDANTFTFEVWEFSEICMVMLNNPPTVSDIIAPVDPQQVGTPISVSAAFEDPPFIYTLIDTHTATWDWGDGASDSGTVTETNGSGSVEGTHEYTAPGIYAITLTVTDNHGDEGVTEYQYVVVYDPYGSFVTGGGWIDSPPGAYNPDPTLTDKATFGFVAKYKKGASVPIGQTEFKFKVADLDFHSDTYDWLVIAGAKAQFKGTGTINGAGNYGFILTAVDSDIPGGGSADKFRIKIWDKDDDFVVYDNKPGESDDSNAATELSGGSIIIHKAN